MNAAKVECVKNTYGSLDSASFVDLMYRNVFNRDAEAKGGVMRWATDGLEFQNQLNKSANVRIVGHENPVIRERLGG